MLLAAQPEQTAIEINLNAAPPVLIQDLNELPMVEDPQEVLIHLNIQVNQAQNNWEMDQDDNQQMMQEILVEQPAQPVP